MKIEATEKLKLSSGNIIYFDDLKNHYFLASCFDKTFLKLDEDISRALIMCDGKSIDKISGLLTLDSCLLYTSPSPRDKRQSRMPSSA